MKSNILLRFESPAVQNYLDMLQGIISRMANNSANCKTWLLGIVTVCLAVFLEKGVSDYLIWVSIASSALFYCLDSFYLGIERNIIRIQKEFVRQVRSGDFEEILYNIPYTSILDKISLTLKALISFSTAPFYIAIIGGLMCLFLTVK